MQRRVGKWFGAAGVFGAALLLLGVGCKNHQYARVIQPGDKEMVGSHQAGQETFKPLIDEAVAKLLGRHEMLPGEMQLTSAGEPVARPRLPICFVGVENKTAEEIGDFKEQIYELIDSKIAESDTFGVVSRRYVEAGLRDLRLRPDQLFVPGNMDMFVRYMQQQGQPFDYLLFAKITSGTTRENKDYQRDYLLTMELVDIRTGQQDKQSATLSKGYHHSWTSRATSQMWPFTK